MSIDVSKLAAPMAFKTGNENTIVNVGDGGGLVANRKTFSSVNIFRWMRSSETKAANNEVRTALLRSLGEAFGLEGMTVGNDGKTRFSQAFMDQLEKLLGADFKRADFGVGRDGVVSSGKPLTERRISAIVVRALVVGKGPFDVSAYRTKVDAMERKAVEAKVSADDLKAIHRRVLRLGKILDFFKNGGLDALVEVNDFYDPEYDPDSDPNYDPRHDEMRCYPYVFHKGDTLVPLKNKDELGLFIQKKYADDVNGNFILHFDNIKATAMNRVPQDSDSEANFLELARTYIHSQLQTFVKASVDMFYDTLGTKVGHDLAKEVFNTNAICVEAQTMETVDFQAERGLFEKPDAVAAKDAAPVTLAVADHDAKTDLLECLAREAQTMEKANHDENKVLGWDDYRPVFVKNLVGLVRPVQIEAGGPVETREVTESDVDALRDRLNEILCFE